MLAARPPKTGGLLVLWNGSHSTRIRVGRLDDVGPRRTSDTIASVVTIGGACVVAAVLLWMIAGFAALGAGELSWAFLTTAPSDAGRSGGMLPILASKCAVVGLCLVVVTPVSLGTAILLADLSANEPSWARASCIARRARQCTALLHWCSCWYLLRSRVSPRSSLVHGAVRDLSYETSVAELE